LLLLGLHAGAEECIPPPLRRRYAHVHADAVALLLPFPALCCCLLCPVLCLALLLTAPTRPSNATNGLLTLTQASLLVPAPEFDHLRSLADSSSSFVVDIAGG
jgi:hypothetical protein